MNGDKAQETRGWPVAASTWDSMGIACHDFVFFHGPCVTWFEATMNDESAKLQAELTSSDFEQALGLAQDKVGFVKAGMFFLGEKTGL